MLIVYTVPNQREKVEYEREKLVSAWRLKVHKQKRFLVAIYIHKKVIFNLKLCGKPMNGNVFGNKTSHSQQAFRAYIRPFSFSSRQP
jgi:hypothetical protein